MTHLSNYGNDRLALYMFESAIKFISCWTNLKLKQVPPIEMAMKYFDMFPEESSPIWRVRKFIYAYQIPICLTTIWQCSLLQNDPVLI